MADFKISRIRFRWVGNWSSAYDYIKDDVVRYGSKTYVALKTHTSSSNFYTDLEAIDTQIPPQPDPNWQLMLDGYEWTNIWQTDTFYQVGDLIKKNGIIYICIDSHNSVNDEVNFMLDIAKWTKYSDGDNWRYNWTTSTSYSINDIVKYNGIIYRCITTHISSNSLNNGLEFDNSKWEIVHSSDDWKYQWQVDTLYKINDVVKYGGNIYRCSTNHLSAIDVNLGLEDDFSSWELVFEGIEYKGDWQSSYVRYKVNDIVKYGANIWICTIYHNSSEPFDTLNWEIYVPGLEYASTWSSSTTYQINDIVRYGGYSYRAKINHSNQIPSTSTTNWELLTSLYNITGDWNLSTNYRVGDTVRRGGQFYTALQDNSGIDTNNSSNWLLTISGVRWRNLWVDAQQYVIGDLVIYLGFTYRCINTHTSAIGNRPDTDITNVYWIVYIEGESTNVLLSFGDLRIYGSSSIQRLPVGTEGNILKSISSLPVWNDFGVIPNIYYVSLNGIDSASNGLTLNAPWRTIRYACQNVVGPATIFVKTGVFEEILPISIPAEVAIVGDELRSTTVQPALGYETSNMFYVRNGCGLRNMTLKGLTGSLSAPNVNGTRRPTAGAYVSLDPGTGPGDSSVWITTRSPYIQNVTTFGTSAIGVKVDGSLHSGGNDSIVANDFTQVISDGIGAWATNLGRMELVSVFSYYAHISYLSENGGKIRATNGNSSYGTFGCVAEGFDLNEVPISGFVNNRYYEAQVESIITNSSGSILLLEYENAGINYTNSSYAFVGTGINAEATGDEFRDSAVFETRIITPGDSSAAGGSSYLVISNNAQIGDNLTVTIAASDENTFANYNGMRIFLISGTGAGQYGYIQAYNDITKVVTVYKESTGTAGWDHVIPGTIIETVLDTTTRYQIEPRVTFSAPAFTTTPRTLPSSASWNSVIYGDGKYVAVSTGTASAFSTNSVTWTAGGSLPASTSWTGLSVGSVGSSIVFVTVGGTTNAASSVNGGTTWTARTMPASATWVSTAYGLISTNPYFVAIANSGTTAAYSTNGTTWVSATLPSSASWRSVTYGNGRFIAIASGGTATAISTNGTTWLAGGALPSSTTWTSVAYGNGRFVAVASGGTAAAYSIDNGTTWTASALPALSNWSSISYGQGLFFAVSTSGTQAATSQNGIVWTSRLLSTSSNGYNDVVFGNTNSDGVWAAIGGGSGTIANSTWSGATAMGRAKVVSGRISMIKMWEPGSGYASIPTLTITDPNNVSEVFTTRRLGNGVLGNPSFLNRGTGWNYVSTITNISGDGHADIYQLGSGLILTNVSLLPGPGDNLNITGINDLTYKVVTVEVLSGTAPNLEIRLNISPSLDREESPDHEVSVSIRQRYSQVRLTGHDFLDIGAGNFVNANYPNIPLLLLAPENEVVEKNGGRVFYTSTDQDGNFRVGELFKVEQATGTVTINASFFQLSGLEELSLGGVSVGGTGVIIREISTDNTFSADSNQIISTQRAIRAYVARRISGGGADATCSFAIAGQVRVGPQLITSTAGSAINIPNKVNITKGVDGSMLAMAMFMDGFDSGDDI